MEICRIILDADLALDAGFRFINETHIYDIRLFMVGLVICDFEAAIHLFE